MSHTLLKAAIKHYEPNYNPNFFSKNNNVVKRQLLESDTRNWLKENLDFSLSKILENISPPHSLPGSIIAAKTKHSPNYYYHWVRDAALTIDSLINIYPNLSKDKKNIVRKKISEYLKFSATIQKLHTLSDLGEPKFHTNGTQFNEPWGRPQNDGPALRAISLIHWANILLAEGKEDFVRKKMYDSKFVSTSPIKMDLEYVSHHWRDPSFDIWEEVKGLHFYTLMVQRRALLEGSELAFLLKDMGAAKWYEAQAQEIENKLKEFWNKDKKHFVSTINQVEGINYKSSGLDTAVILGLLHGDMNDHFISWDDQRILSTLNQIIFSFSEIYPINHNVHIPGIAIGRYPEDKYAGDNFNGGNPWPICTLAIAEAYYRHARLLTEQNKVDKASRILNIADQYVNLVRFHAHQDGSLNEQIDKNTGLMTSVYDLTWNYSALLTTHESIPKLDHGSYKENKYHMSRHSI